MSISSKELHEFGDGDGSDKSTVSGVIPLMTFLSLKHKIKENYQKNYIPPIDSHFCKITIKNPSNLGGLHNLKQRLIYFLLIAGWRGGEEL